MNWFARTCINGNVECGFRGMELVLMAPLPHELVVMVTLGWEVVLMVMLPDELSYGNGTIH